MEKQNNNENLSTQEALIEAIKKNYPSDEALEKEMERIHPKEKQTIENEEKQGPAPS